MRELNMIEIETVSGAGFFGNLFMTAASVAYGAVLGATTGMEKVGVSGGSTGGILGVGVISALVGVGLGGISGAIYGGMAGLVTPFDVMAAKFNNTFDQWIDLTLPAPKV